MIKNLKSCPVLKNFLQNRTKQPEKEVNKIETSINRLLRIELQIHSCLKNPEKYAETLNILYDMKAAEKNHLKAIRNDN